MSINGKSSSRDKPACKAATATIITLLNRGVTMKLLLFTLLLIFIFLTSSGLSYAERLTCPAAIKVQESVTETPDGWAAISEGTPHNLKGISFYDGHPEKMGSLSPEKETEKKGRLYSVWRFDAKTAKNLWLSCSYGQTNMVFIRPANKAYSKCAVISDMGESIDGQPLLVSIECK